MKQKAYTLPVRFDNKIVVPSKEVRFDPYKTPEEAKVGDFILVSRWENGATTVYVPRPPASPEDMSAVWVFRSHICQLGEIDFLVNAPRIRVWERVQ